MASLGEALRWLKERKKVYVPGNKGYFWMNGLGAIKFIDDGIQHEVPAMNLRDDYQILEEPQKKKVFQWRYLTKSGDWIISATLMDDAQAEKLLKLSDFLEHEIHAGPFEVRA